MNKKNHSAKKSFLFFSILGVLTIGSYSLANIIGIASTDTQGEYANEYSAGPTLSQNGSKIAHLQGNQLWVFDTTTQNSRYVDETNGDKPYISANGSYVAYTKASDANTYIYDLESNKTVFLDQWGTAVFGGYRFPSLSADGKKVCMQKDGNIAIYDITDANNIVALSPSQEIGGINQHCHISSNGQYVVFEHIDNHMIYFYDIGAQKLISITEGQDATVTSNGYITYRNGSNIYLYNTIDGSNKLINEGMGPDISDDARYISFSTNNVLTQNDTNTQTDIYVYDVVNDAYLLVSLYNGIQSDSMLGDIKMEMAQIAISDDGSIVAMHGHDNTWFSNKNDAQVFYAQNSLKQVNNEAINDSYNGMQGETIVGNITDNDTIQSGVQEIVVENQPKHGVLDIDKNKGDFIYTPDTTWCDQNNSSGYIFPTDTTNIENSSETITQFFALIDMNTYQEYFIDPNNVDAHIALSDEGKMREWIINNPILTANFTYSYDAEKNVGIFDYIGDPKQNNWIIYLGDNGKYFYKKPIDGKYVGTSLGSSSDSFTYYVIDQGGVKTNLATVDLHVSCVQKIVGAKEDVFQGTINTNLNGIVSENDTLPENGTKGFFLYHKPKNGEIINFNEIDGSFEYMPNKDRCGVYGSGKGYIHPTTNIVEKFDATALYGISNKESGNSYFITPKQNEGIALDNQVAIRQWIASVPELTNNITYTYDSEYQIGIFDYIGVGNPGAWILSMSDKVTQGDIYDKVLDGGYDNSSFEQGDYFTYYFADKETGVPYNLARVNISVPCPGFVLINDMFVGDEDKELIGNVADNDVLPKNMKAFLIRTMPEYGSVSLDEKTGEFTYIPQENYCVGEKETDDKFQYYVIDENGNELNTADVAVHVNCINDAPYATGAEITIPLDSATGTAIFTVTGTDADSSNISYSLVTTAYNSFAITKAGELILIEPLPQIADTYSLQVAISDDLGAETIITIIIHTTSNGGGGGKESTTGSVYTGNTNSGSTNTGIISTGVITTGVVGYSAGGATSINTPHANQISLIPSSSQSPSQTTQGGSNELLSPVITFNPEQILNPSIEKMCTKIDIDVVLYEKGLGLSPYYKEALYFARLFDLTRYGDTLSYRPRDYVTREEAAKLFSQFATKILCRSPYLQYNDSVFSDITTADPTLIPYIKQAYELGIFKGGEGKFRPTDLLSKEETIAILMRLLTRQIAQENGDAWGVPYQNDALQAGLLADTKNLQGSFTRSYIIQKLYAAYKNIPFVLDRNEYVFQLKK